MNNDELIEKAASVLNRHTAGGRLFGDVGAALVTEKGDIHAGVCIDTASWGLCAERSAIAAMATDGEYKIQKIVSVWRDERDGKLYVLPPCGHCRQFMRDVNEANLETEIILGRTESAKLKDLIPHYEWPQSLD